MEGGHLTTVNEAAPRVKPGALGTIIAKYGEDTLSVEFAKFPDVRYPVCRIVGGPEESDGVKHPVSSPVKMRHHNSEVARIYPRQSCG